MLAARVALFSYSNRMWSQAVTERGLPSASTKEQSQLAKAEVGNGRKVGVHLTEETCGS